MKPAGSLLILAVATVIADAAAQTADYHQSAGDDANNPNSLLVIERLSPAGRVPVRAGINQPLERVQLNGYRDMYCAPKLSIDALTGRATSAGGALAFQHALFVRVSAMDSAAMRDALQRAENASDRSEQYRELFGITLPDLNGSLSDAVSVELNYEERSRLLTGQEVAIKFAIDRPNAGLAFECATIAQVDAAIAEAKRVYAAVISAMQARARRKP